MYYLLRPSLGETTGFWLRLVMVCWLRLVTSDVLKTGGFLRSAANETMLVFFPGPENRKGIILKIRHVYKGKACSQQFFGI